MYTLLMVLFVILSVFMVIFILIQPGKGDMGLGSMGSSSQMLFGGSGGQSFFEKTTWVMGALFIMGALGLAVLQTHERHTSQLEGFSITKKTPTAPVQQPALPTNPIQK